MTESLLPPHIKQHIYGSEVTWILGGKDTEQCEGAKYHSPRPLVTDDTLLVLVDWWPEDHPSAPWSTGPRAWLCGTCRDNLSVLLQMLHHTDGDLDWKVRREFGNDLRALAMKGWQWFTEQPVSR